MFTSNPARQMRHSWVGGALSPLRCFLSGEAHDQKSKAVSGDLVSSLSSAVGIGSGDLLKIEAMKFRGALEFVNVPNDVVMPFVEFVSHIKGSCPKPIPLTDDDDLRRLSCWNEFLHGSIVLQFRAGSVSIVKVMACASPFHVALIILSTCFL